MFARLALSTVAILSVISASAVAEENATGPYKSEMDYLESRWDRTKSISSQDALGIVRAVELLISDQVDGGCWTNVSAVQARVRAELERSGIAVFSEPMAIYNALSPQVQIDVLGYRAGDGLCVAHATMKVAFLSESEMGSLAYTGSVFRVVSEATMWERAFIASGSSLNEQIINKLQEWTDTLVADVAASKRSVVVRDFLGTWHSEMPQTRAQTEASMKTMLDEMGVSR